MFALSFYLLSLLYLTLSISEDEFIIVSTTQNPSEKQEIKELKSRLEFLESKNKQSTTDEIQYRLELLELKNKQITVNENINSFVKRLEVLLESRNEQSKVIYEKMKNEQSATDEKINKILNKFDNLDSKIEEIAQKFRTMNQTLSQSINYNDADLPKNCREVQQRGHKVSKIFKIQPEFSPKPFEVLCDMERRGGGWTYFLNRFEGTQEFNLEWNDYKTGFGRPSEEFWLGLENIRYLTGSEINELLVELMDWDDKVVHAHYDAFSVSSESEGYSLKVLGKYEGTAGNSFEGSAKIKFSTKDRDQDEWSNSCAKVYGGEWWHSACGYSLLTGKYYKKNMLNSVTWATGMYWYGFHGFGYSLKHAKMMVRPKTN